MKKMMAMVMVLVMMIGFTACNFSTNEKTLSLTCPLCGSHDFVYGVNKCIIYMNGKPMYIKGSMCMDCGHII